jgi:flagellar FliL protein
MTDRAVDDDAEVPQAAEAEKPAGSRWKKLALLVGAPLLAFILIGAGLWVTGIGPRMLGMGGGHGEVGEKAEAPQPGPPKKAVFYDLPDLLVNLNGGGRKTSFLKISISIELEDAGDVPKLQGVMPRIIDNFQVYLRELRAEDLKGSAGMYRLREELLTRVGAAAAPAKINDVLFKEMLVQ